MRKWTVLALLLAVISIAPPIGGHRAMAQPASALSDQQKLVDQSVGVIETMRSDADFPRFRGLFQRAKGVLIVPQLTKGGVIVGGQGGAGLLLARQPDGSWSDPAYYSIGGGTFGLQIGVQQAQMVFFIMSTSGLQAFMHDQVNFGAQNGIAVFVVGQEHQDQAITQDRADVVVWARASGAYAGITVEGTSISFDGDNTAKYYGRRVTLDDVIIRRTVENPNADRLRRLLAAV
jgi:SH3 domain-containing YSC84-like protein 1